MWKLFNRISSFEDSPISEVQDEDLKNRVLRDLEKQNITSLRLIEVEVLSGIVLLSGTVENYHHKQVAQEVWKRVAGILGVQNGIEVRRQLVQASSN